MITTIDSIVDARRDADGTLNHEDVFRILAQRQRAADLVSPVATNDSSLMSSRTRSRCFRPTIPSYSSSSVNATIQRRSSSPHKLPSSNSVMKANLPSSSSLSYHSTLSVSRSNSSNANSGKGHSRSDTPSKRSEQDPVKGARTGLLSVDVDDASRQRGRHSSRRP
jgi:hypothetical protein